MSSNHLVFEDGLGKIAEPSEECLYNPVFCPWIKRWLEESILGPGTDGSMCVSMTGPVKRPQPRDDFSNKLSNSR
jgi:hypothetical protein